ncbi:MAG: hypothetical protein MI743_19405 [Sneathiellales bacterium]|nr:hypothetical protein [Sneathiellales bacterium]
MASGQVCQKGELATRVDLKRPRAGAAQGYRKVKHAAIGWSIASLAFNISPGFARLAVSGATSIPCRLEHVEQHLITGDGSLNDAIEADFERVTFEGDSYASASYRKKRLAVLVNRTIEEISAPAS